MALLVLLSLCVLLLLQLVWLKLLDVEVVVGAVDMPDVVGRGLE